MAKIRVIRPHRPVRSPKTLAFINSVAGRLLRVVLGIVVVLTGAAIGSTSGWILSILGFEPILAGIFDFSVLGPLFASGLRGETMRRDLNDRTRMVRAREKGDEEYPPFAA